MYILLPFRVSFLFSTLTTYIIKSFFSSFFLPSCRSPSSSSFFFGVDRKILALMLAHVYKSANIVCQNLLFDYRLLYVSRLPAAAITTNST